MLVTFFTFSTGAAIDDAKPLLESDLASFSVPFRSHWSLNILRITATGVMYQINERFAQQSFHDLAGWFMTPICLMFLAVESWALNRLIIEVGRPKSAMPSSR